MNHEAQGNMKLDPNR